MLRSKTILLFLLLLFVGLPIAALSTLPWYAHWVKIPQLQLDLKDELPPETRALLNSTQVSAQIKLEASERGGILVSARGEIFGWPYTFMADIDYSVVFLRGDADFDFAFEEEGWSISGSCRATPSTWRAQAKIVEGELSDQRPILRDILSKLKVEGISDIALTARVDIDVQAEKTKEVPVPAWWAQVSVKNASAFMSAGENPITLRGANVTMTAEGIANKVFIHPIIPRIRSVSISDIQLSNVFAAIHKTEKALLVSEASAEVCGGEVKVYSLFLNPESLTAGFTLFLDDIDANELMAQVKDFRGDASGRLHGKMPLFLKNGNELRLKNAYLYSTPGEKGHIRVRDASPILDNLAMGGVDEQTRTNLEKALANLLYSVLKLDLRREADGTMALGLKIEGEAMSGKTTVPVSFQVTFRGDFEQLINTGIRIKQQ